VNTRVKNANACMGTAATVGYRNYGVVLHLRNNRGGRLFTTPCKRLCKRYIADPFGVHGREPNTTAGRHEASFDVSCAVCHIPLQHHMAYLQEKKVMCVTSGTEEEPVTPHLLLCPGFKSWASLSGLKVFFSPLGPLGALSCRE
jgi:hypothetical protein